MIEKIAASRGKNASAMQINPAGQAITRLVAPVAIESPTLLENVDCPTPPNTPDKAEQIPPARIPPLTSFISVRFHSESLIFSQSVKSPTVLSIEQTLAIRNGSIISNLKRRAEGKRGKPSNGTSRI